MQPKSSNSGLLHFNKDVRYQFYINFISSSLQIKYHKKVIYELSINSWPQPPGPPFCSYGTNFWASDFGYKKRYDKKIGDAELPNLKSQYSQRQ